MTTAHTHIPFANRIPSRKVLEGYKFRKNLSDFLALRSFLDERVREGGGGGGGGGGGLEKTLGFGLAAKRQRRLYLLPLQPFRLSADRKQGEEIGGLARPRLTGCVLRYGLERDVERGRERRTRHMWICAEFA